jgi:Zn-dependent peptidase ImmA (M78 family)
MNQAVRSHVAKQIHAAMTRQGIGLPELAKASGISQGIIREYEDAAREIRFLELRPIFESLGKDLIQALTAKPVTAHISLRNTSDRDRQLTTNLSKAFLRIEDLLPKPKLPHFAVRLDDSADDPSMLLSEVKNATELVQQGLGHDRFEDAYRQWKIPVIGLNLGKDALDGLCLSASSGKVLVIVNLDQSDTRLRFTLLHELWHAIFDQKKDIPPDHLGLDFYREKIPKDVIPEYRANKWAQLWLVSWNVASNAYDHFKKSPDISWVGPVLAQTGASSMVLANAIFDVARFTHGKMTYASIRDRLQQNHETVASPDLANTRRLVEAETQSIGRLIESHEAEFGESVLQTIRTTFQLKLGA